MAVDVHHSRRAAQEPVRPLMPRDFQVRTTAVLLAIFTLAAVCLAYVNLQAERRYNLPYDGVWWLERNGSLQAEKVTAEGPGDLAGIRAHDTLLQVNGQEATTAAAVNRALFRAGVYSKVEYHLQRRGVPIDVQLITVPTDRSL